MTTQSSFHTGAIIGGVVGGIAGTIIIIITITIIQAAILVHHYNKIIRGKKKMDGNPCWSITSHFTHWCTVYQFINGGLEMIRSIQLAFILLTDMVVTNMMDTYQDLTTCKDIYH